MVVVHDFAKPKSKHALSVHLKNSPDDKERRWRKDAIDAFVSHEELIDWMDAGGIDHGELTGLADDDHTQYILAAGTRALTADWDAGSFEIRAKTLESDVAIGTAPLTITSTTAVTNLNADLLDGDHSSEFFHNDVSGEINVLTVKTPPVGADVILIEDSGATFAKKKVTLTDVIALVPVGITDHGALSGLSDDDHTQYLLAAGTRGLSGDWDAGTFEIRANTFESDVATGTAPFTIASTTVNTNLNADLLDGNEASAFVKISGTPVDNQMAMWTAADTIEGAAAITNANIVTFSGGLATGNLGAVSNVVLGPPYFSLTDSGIVPGTVLLSGGTIPLTADWDAGSFEIRAQTFESDVATGTAPFVVASTTMVSKLNADQLDGDDSSEFFHNNVVNEIAALTEKATPIDDDVILIEDSEALYAKKFIKFSAIPFGTTTGGGSEFDLDFEDEEGYISGETLSTMGDWTALVGWAEWSSSHQTPPGGSEEGCIIKNATTTAGARDRYNVATWTSGVVSVYFQIQGNVNQICGLWLGDSTFAADGIYFGLVTTTGGDTTGFQYASYGTPETYHTHFGTTNSSTNYWIRAYVDLDNGLGKMKGWSGAIGDEPAAWGVERTFTGAFPSPMHLAVHASQTSNSASIIRIWNMALTNDSIVPGTLGDLDHGILEGLTDDDHTQYLLASGTRGLTANWDAGTFEIRANTFESDVATGTIPLVIASTTKCTNLNADQLDGLDDTAFIKAAGTVALSANWDAGTYTIQNDIIQADTRVNAKILETTLAKTLVDNTADSFFKWNPTTKGDHGYWVIDYSIFVEYTISAVTYFYQKAGTLSWFCYRDATQMAAGTLTEISAPAATNTGAGVFSITLSGTSAGAAPKGPSFIVDLSGVGTSWVSGTIQYTVISCDSDHRGYTTFT